MKLKIFIAIATLTAAALIGFSQMKERAFAPAEDFPRGAILYAQVNDLPAFIKLWNESKFRGKYLASENYKDFANNHLGRKLASRWSEFSEASGFSMDLETAAGLTENQAAIALYDIGKLEFVFVAPMNEQVFAATKFVQNQNKFAEETLPDGTIIYRATVEADRGRQKQELIFTNAGGRFILATNEKLLAQTLSNIAGKTKNRLSDEPAFAALSENFAPRVAAVWINQAVLNDDYYFKRYWLMSNGENLKNLRAGIFNFEIEEGKLIEQRKFLLDENVNIAPIENVQTAELLSFIPEDVPFYRLQSANPKTIDEAVKSTVFNRSKPEAVQAVNHQFYFSTFNDYDDYSSGDYSSLNEDFDEEITHTGEEKIIESRFTDVDFSKLLQPAAPRSVLTFASPQILPAPLFVEFRRAAIFNFASPSDFNRDDFEAAIAEKFSEQTMISAPGVKLNWESATFDGFSQRRLKIPMLGFEACYAIRGRELILANDSDFLQIVLSQSNSSKSADSIAPMTGLTVVNLDKRENAYDLVFAELIKNKTADDFFTGNVASLLDAFSEVGKIEIRENYSGRFYEQEIVLKFK